MSDSLIDLLQQALRLESRSFLIYARDACDPRVEARDRDVKTVLDRIILHEEEDLDALLTLLESHGGHPDMSRTFAMDATGYHFLELDYLIRVVCEKQRDHLDQFRAVYEQVAALDPAAGQQLGRITRRKQQDLQAVEALQEQVRVKHGTAEIEQNTTVEPRRRG